MAVLKSGSLFPTETVKEIFSKVNAASRFLKFAENVELDSAIQGGHPMSRVLRQPLERRSLDFLTMFPKVGGVRQVTKRTRSTPLSPGKV